METKQIAGGPSQCFGLVSPLGEEALTVFYDLTPTDWFDVGGATLA
jgi:hypothetical protein